MICPAPTQVSGTPALLVAAGSGDRDPVRYAGAMRAAPIAEWLEKHLAKEGTAPGGHRGAGGGKGGSSAHPRPGQRHDELR